MEELIYKMENFYPLNPDSPIKGYLKHHSENLSNCVENNLYSSGFYHLHLCFMTVIYTQIERILSNISPKERRIALIGFARQENELYTKEGDTIKAGSLSVLKEKTVFRFFRIIINNDELIKETSALVQYRNDIFHAKPSIDLLREEKEFFNRFEKYISILEHITTESINFLEEIYRKTLQIFQDEVTEDDLYNEFGSFSKHELIMMANKQNDPVSKRIKEIW